MVSAISYRPVKKIMKAVLGICLLVLPNVAFPQSGLSFDFTFVAEDAGGRAFYNEKGNVLASGGMYRVEIPGEFLVLCDGTSQWIYNFGTDDVIVAHSEISKSPEAAGGANVPVPVVEKLVSLFTGDSKNYRTSIKKDANGMPVEVTVRSTKDVYKVKIGALKQLGNCSRENFTFDLQKYPDAIVTDLR